MTTIEQLEERVHDLECQLAELRAVLSPLWPLASVRETFGMFGAAPGFDEIVRLGREYRNQANSREE